MAAIFPGTARLENDDALSFASVEFDKLGRHSRKSIKGGHRY